VAHSFVNPLFINATCHIAYAENPCGKTLTGYDFTSTKEILLERRKEN